MRKWTVLSLSLLALGATGIMLAAPWQQTRTPKDPQSAYPLKLSERVLVFHGNKDQRIRRMIYAEDGFTPLYAETDFSDGDTGRINFRPNFTAYEILRYFAVGASVGPAGQPLLKSSFKIDTDGRKIKEVREFDKNQNLLLEGDRVVDDNYRERIYFPGTKNISRFRLLSPRAMVLGGMQFDPILILHEVGYYPSTAQKYVYLKIDTVTFERTGYFESGAIESYDHRFGRKHSGYINWPNGRMKVSYQKVQKSNDQWSSEWIVQSQSFSELGAVYDDRIFGWTYMKVSLLIPGMVNVVQDWRLNDEKLTGQARLAIANYSLNSVTMPVFGSWKNVTLLLHKDGKSLKELWHNYMDGDVQMNVFLEIRADGTIAKKRVVNSRTLKADEIEYKGNEGGTVNVPSQFFTMITSYELPVAVPEAPDYYYGWP